LAFVFADFDPELGLVSDVAEACSHGAEDENF
jgi:hypothetical protein